MATRARIDIGFRVGPGTNTIRVAYPTGAGYVDCTIASGLYMTAATLAAAIDTAVKTASANLSCVNSGRVFTIASAGLNFDIEILQLTLKNWLGAFDATNVAAMAGNGAGIFISTWPWRGLEATWCRNRKVATADHGKARIVHLSAWYEWHAVALITGAELATFRSVFSYAIRGQPFTLYADSTKLSEWDWSDYYQGRQVVLTPDSARYVERWLTSPHQTLAEVDIVARGFAE